MCAVAATKDISDFGQGKLSYEDPIPRRLHLRYRVAGGREKNGEIAQEEKVLSETIWNDVVSD